MGGREKVAGPECRHRFRDCHTRTEAYRWNMWAQLLSSCCRTRCGGAAVEQLFLG